MMRPTIDEYFLEIAKVVSTRSTCLHRHIGAVIVKDGIILSCGYNGPPSGYPHCTVCARANVESGTRIELCKASHAEQNAIAFSARFGMAIDKSTMYSTTKPCSTCAKSIINAGIERIIYVNDYPDRLADEILSLIETIQKEK